MKKLCSSTFAGTFTVLPDSSTSSFAHSFSAVRTKKARCWSAVFFARNSRNGSAARDARSVL